MSLLCLRLSPSYYCPWLECEEVLHRMYVPALRLPPVGLLAEEKAKEDPPVPTPPNPGPPPKPVGESDIGRQFWTKHTRSAYKERRLRGGGGGSHTGKSLTGGAEDNTGITAQFIAKQSQKRGLKKMKTHAIPMCVQTIHPPLV